MNNFRTQDIEGLLDFISALLSQKLDLYEMRICTRHVESDKDAFCVEWFKKEDEEDSAHFIYVDKDHEVVQRVWLPNGDLILAQEGVNTDDIIRDWELDHMDIEDLQSYDEKEDCKEEEE